MDFQFLLDNNTLQDIPFLMLHRQFHCYCNMFPEHTEYHYIALN